MLLALFRVAMLPQIDGRPRRDPRAMSDAHGETVSGLSLVQSQLLLGLPSVTPHGHIANLQAKAGPPTKDQRGPPPRVTMRPIPDVHARNRGQAG